MSQYRSEPQDSATMPSGIPYIIGNEAAERFSFYGMRAILVVFMTKYLWLMDRQAGNPMGNAQATEVFHNFVTWVYITPFLGALLSDIFLGKYRTIMILSIVYCLGHAALAFMGFQGESKTWLYAGLFLICLGSGGIKPCVSAHVGDQFGARNQHLLSKIYNWFYFSINFGSFFSTLLTPWLLEWYGPHWAFGIPGVLMAIATLMFWLGRNQFIHVPAAGKKFFDEISSKEGLFALLKLIPLFLFIAIFWALYDQTGSSWVLQAEHTNLDFLGMKWLPSQIQAINPILILVFIPLFTVVIYPLIQRVFRLTPLRKIGIGFFLTAAAFAIVALTQHWIDAGGEKPSVSWQLLAFFIITAAEVMVSIVGLEFAYTQAPAKMKSIVMALYLSAVAVGNLLTSKINHFIQIPSAAKEQYESLSATQLLNINDSQVALPGYDGIKDTSDDITAQIKKQQITEIALTKETSQSFQNAADQVIALAKSTNDQFSAATPFPPLGNDSWGNPISAKIINATTCRISSAGPDRQRDTAWDTGLTIEISTPEVPRESSWMDVIRPNETWIETRKAILNVEREKPSTTTYDITWFVGGQNKLEGVSYFSFFTWLMLGCAVLYVPFALCYRPKTYLPADVSTPEVKDPSAI